MEPVEGPEAFHALLKAETPPTISSEAMVSEEEWLEWNEGFRAVEVTDEVRALIARVREVLQKHNDKRSVQGDAPIYVSDRRWKELTKALKASAYFHDRNKVDPLDCVLLRHGIWERPEQIDEVNTIIRTAILEHAQSDRFDTKRLRLEFRRLSDEIENHRIDYREEPVQEFERIRGEYFVIDEFIEDLVTLIWIDDFQSLSTEEPKSVELFFYDEDVLSHTDTFMVRRAGEGSVEINGDIFPLKGAEVRRTVAERRALGGEEAREFRTRLSALTDTCRKRIEEIERLRTAGESESFEHLFVKREYAKILLDGLEESEQTLVSLESEIKAYEAEAFVTEGA